MQKILVSKRRAIGDSVLMLPALQYLRANFPTAEITVLVPKSSQAVFQYHPGVTRIWVYEEHSLLSWLFKIRQEKFDLFLDLNATGRSQILCTFSGAKQKFSHRHSKKTENRYTKRPDGIDWDLFALQDAGFSNTNNFSKEPQIFLNEQEIQQAKDFWQNHGVKPKQVVVLGTGASRVTKRWPAEYFARFAELVRDRLELPVAFIVGPGFEEEEFAAEILNCLRVKGFTVQSTTKNFGSVNQVTYHSGASLRELMALLATSAAYVGNDSGPKHIAIAVGIPTVTMFGPEDPIEWHPYNQQQHPRFFIPNLSCRNEDNGRWCSIPVCIEQKHRCMRDLVPEDVFPVFQKLLQKQ